MRYKVEIIAEYEAESDAQAVERADAISDAVIEHELCTHGLVTGSPERV